MRRPIPTVEAATAYRVPRHPAPIDCWLAGNEGRTPPADVLAVLPGDLARGYPSAADLEAALAERFAVDPAQVLVTAGADDGLDRVCRAYLDSTRRAVIPTPTFGMLLRYARLTGAAVDTPAWPAGAWPLDAVRSALRPDTALVCVVSPNNPTGQVATAADLAAISAAAPDAVVLLDHAYVEYADVDLTAAALALPNVVVARTFSKAWGLAGLRVGYLLGPAAVIGALRRVGNPYAVSGPSLAVARRQLATADIAPHIAAVRRERARLIAGLRALDVPTLDSQANCVLVEGSRVDWLRDAWAGLGIGVRAWPGEARLRISVPDDPAVTDRVLAAARAALEPEAILFDMDGVLADVSASYRAAIVAAGAAFGVTLTAAEISAAKAAGDANNDWILTRRLLAARGVDVPLDRVTAAFEAAYQGGLWRKERLLVERTWLAEQAARRPLGIVTGRPRGDAERFLAEHGIADCFQALICMEDAPAKPDPAPVRAALTALGVTRAWLVGDTPDDIRAARAAGVVPLGICAPGEDSAAALSAAGAARILDRLEALPCVG